MERLISGVQSQVSQIFPEKPPAKELYLCPADTITELPGKIKTASQNFGLFLALNAKNLRSEEIGQAAKKLVEGGLAYFCAWGPDCERVHDIFDQSSEKRNSELTGDDVIMTTWHSDETLIEALWFFIHSAFPTQCFVTSCTDWVIAPIGNHDWELEIRSKIREAAFLPAPD